MLEKLREGLAEDNSVWRVFVQNFIALLPDRIRGVQLALTTGDLAAALDAALSLKTSGVDTSVSAVWASRVPEISTSTLWLKPSSGFRV